MRKVKTFFHIFYNSLIPHVRYYSHILKINFRTSLKYLILLIFILNVIFICSLIVKYNPSKINQTLDGVITSLHEYPDNLTIFVGKGSLMTNFDKPYFFWVNLPGQNQLVAVIDEFAEPSKIREYGALAMFTNKDIVTQNSNTKELTVIPYSEGPVQTITKSSMNKIISIVDRLKLLLPFLYLIAVIIMLIALPIASFITTMFYLLLSSLLIFLFYRFIIQKRFTFKRIVQISFHAVTFPLSIDYILTIFRPSLKISNASLYSITPPPFPVLFFILVVTFIAAGVYETHFEEQSSRITAAHKHPHHLHKAS